MDSFQAKFAPRCPYCGNLARLVPGEELFPYSREALKRVFWRCDPCDAHVGCHQGTLQPLGVPANAALRRARMELHRDVLDPIWKTAADLPRYNRNRERNRAAITRAARDRTYAWMAEKLGLDPRDAHVGMFDLETCGKARKLLEGVSYLQIRLWHKNKVEEEKKRLRAAQAEAMEAA